MLHHDINTGAELIASWKAGFLGAKFLNDERAPGNFEFFEPPPKSSIKAVSIRGASCPVLLTACHAYSFELIDDTKAL